MIPETNSSQQLTKAVATSLIYLKELRDLVQLHFILRHAKKGIIILFEVLFLIAFLIVLVGGTLYMLDLSEVLENINQLIALLEDDSNFHYVKGIQIKIEELIVFGYMFILTLSLLLFMISRMMARARKRVNIQRKMEETLTKVIQALEPNSDY